MYPGVWIHHLTWMWNRHYITIRCKHCPLNLVFCHREIAVMHQATFTMTVSSTECVLEQLNLTMNNNTEIKAIEARAMGLFHERFASSPQYSPEIYVLQKSYFVWECQAETKRDFWLYVFPRDYIFARLFWRLFRIIFQMTAIIVPDNGLSPVWRKANIWNIDGWSFIRPFGKKVSMYSFLLKNMNLKISSAKWWPLCLGLNVVKAEGNVILSTNLTVSRKSAQS